MKYKNGFTIVELMVVVGIIAILLVLMFANFSKVRSSSRDKVRVTDIDQIRLALEEYRWQCGEYPATLELDQDNGDCPDDFTLGSVLFEIPENPEYSETPVYFAEEYDIEDSYNGYLYAGLSTRSNGPCFEYHLGVPLESGYEDGSYGIGEYFGNDYDCDSAGPAYRFTHSCQDSLDDFNEADDDATFGVYDFRSQNNCS